MDLQDPESGEIMTVDTSSLLFRETYKQSHKNRKAQRDKMLRLAQVERIDVVTQGDYFDPLIKYFRKKAHG